VPLLFKRFGICVVNWEDLPSLIPGFPAVHPTTSSIHNTHQCLLMASKVDFIGAKNCLKPFLLVLLIFLTSHFAYLINGSFVILISKNTHMLAAGQRNYFNLITQFVFYLCNYLRHLRMSSRTVNYGDAFAIV
jgi:hypothetical protein